MLLTPNEGTENGAAKPVETLSFTPGSDGGGNPKAIAELCALSRWAASAKLIPG